MRRFRRGDPAPGLPPGFGTIWAAVAVDLVGFGIVLPILPIYARRFHASTLEAALLVTAFSAAGFAFAPLWGRLSDRFGRRPVILVSLAGTAVGSLLTGLAGGLPLLFAGRLIDGASGASVSVAQAAAADMAAGSPAEGREAQQRRARLFGLLGAAFGVGFVAGPAIGALAALGGPRVPFLVAAGLAALNTAVAWFRLPETRRAAPPGSGPPGPRLAPWKEASESGVASLLLVAFAAMVAFSGFEATFSLYGQRHLGLAIASTAAVFTGVGAVIVVVQVGAVAKVTRRIGEVRTLELGLAGNTAGLILLALSRSWAAAAPALLLLTVGQGLVQTTMASVLAARAGPWRRGRALGLQQSVSSLARIAGPAAGGALLGGAASGSAYVLGAALTGAALLGVTAVGTGRPADRRDIPI
jgi:DHA1 family tetracycline resistance protein-like MFS transporter